MAAKKIHLSRRSIRWRTKTTNGDPDPRLSRCAVYDGYYILVKDLVKEIPKEK